MSIKQHPSNKGRRRSTGWAYRYRVSASYGNPPAAFKAGEFVILRDDRGNVHTTYDVQGRPGGVARQARVRRADHGIRGNQNGGCVLNQFNGPGPHLRADRGHGQPAPDPDRVINRMGAWIVAGIVVALVGFGAFMVMLGVAAIHLAQR
jgi:hypothetical protein